MNYRTPLLLAATILALSACANDAAHDRPRLLAIEEARIGDLNRVDERSVSLDQPAELMRVELTSCWHAPEASSTPRLVIGEPVCVVGARSIARRID